MFKFRSILIFSIISGTLLSYSLKYLLGGPSYEGQITVKGINNDVKISRNKYGIPTIIGEDYRSMLYALGYAHAQDRLWQMNFKRLALKGSLSKYFGEKVLKVDIFMRKLGFHLAAQEETKYLDIETLEKLRIYIKGINDYIDSLNFLPMEFWITWTTVEQFDVLDIISLYKAQGFMMNYERRNILVTQFALEIFDYNQLEEIFAPSFEKEIFKTTILKDNPFGVYSPKDSKKLKQKLEKERYYSNNISKESASFLEDMGIIGFAASNNWVVHGNYTKSGKAILANDPHLDNSMPSFWYPVRFYFKNGSKLIGATVPLSPIFAIGKNDKVAWGVTASRTNFIDIVEEKLSEDGNRYFYEGKWYDLSIREEKILIKGKDEPHIEKVKTSRNGPIFNEIIDSYLVQNFETNKHIAIRTQILFKNDPALTKYLNLQTDRNIDNIISELSKVRFFPLNFVLASGKDIAYVHTGDIPIHNNPSKFGIKDGTKKEDDWIGLFESPIFIKNPKDGFIVTANNRLMESHRLGILERIISTPRAYRISSVLSSYIKNGDKISISHMKNLQCDLYDPLAEKLVPALQSISKEKITLTLNATMMMRELNYWDFQTSKTSIGATIFNYIEEKIKTKLMMEIPNRIRRMLVVKNDYVENFLYSLIIDISKGNSTGNSFICGQTNGNCLEIIRLSIEETFKELSEKLGDEMTKWEFGKIKKVIYKSATFKNTPLGKYFERSLPAGGNKRTVNVGFSTSPHEPFVSHHTANYRTLVDLGSLNDNLFIIDTGVNENLLSSHYDDLMALNDKCEYLLMEDEPLDKDDLFILKKAN